MGNFKLDTAISGLKKEILDKVFIEPTSNKKFRVINIKAGVRTTDGTPIDVYLVCVENPKMTAIHRLWDFYKLYKEDFSTQNNKVTCVQSKYRF